jgi:hypothetical protein
MISHAYELPDTAIDELIGKRCKNIQAEEAEKYILGYTRLQRRDGP